MRMHLSIPDAVELKDQKGSTYTGFVLHVNGVRHCVVRYRQLHALHEQLRRDLPLSALPPFPPKKLMPLSPAQLEDRRSQLERYLQLSCQDPRILHGVTLNGFLLGAQQETGLASSSSPAEQHHRGEVTLDVYLMNDHKIAVRGAAVLQTDEVLERVCKELDIPPDLVYYFGLFLIERRQHSGELVILRKLQDFESPYISQRSSTRKLVIRKACWDPKLDERLFAHPSTLNLLYLQTISEVESGWISPGGGQEGSKALATMQARGAKLEYMKTASRLPYYGYLRFEPCICDYPCTMTPAHVSIGDRELVLRIVSPGHGDKTGRFKVTKMRCWRIMTVAKGQSGDLDVVDDPDDDGSSRMDLELSFEYLMHSGELQWITIVSRQAILMSLCLHSMVEELLREKSGGGIRKAGEKSCSVDYPFLCRDGTVQNVPIRTCPHGRIPSDTAIPTQKMDSASLSSLTSRQYSVKRLSEKFATIRFRDAANAAEDVLFENEAFAGVSNSGSNGSSSNNNDFVAIR